MTAQPQLLPRRKLLFSPLVLIYQMPKIGSQTIESTLQGCGFPHPVRRFHYLSPTIARTVRRGVSSDKPDPAWKKDAQFQLNLAREMTRVLRLRRGLSLLGFKVPKLYVITAVRELIGLVLSSIFENYLSFAPTIEAMTVERCRDALLHPKTFKALRDWFDLELKRFIRIDVYETPFLTNQGWMIYENRFARVLLYRFDVLNQLPKLLQDSLHWEVPTLVSSNLGEQKAYADQYQMVRTKLRLPPDFVNDLYETKMMRHFYREDERRQLMQKWAETSPQTSRDLTIETA